MIPIAFPDTLPRLITERLVLRALEAADGPALFAIFSDPEVMRYWHTPPMEAIAEAEALPGKAAAAFSQGTGLRWGLQRCDDSQLVGTCALFHLDLEQGRAEIGYALGRAVWRQGLMQEALCAVLAYGFDEHGLNLRRVEAELDPRNLPSARTLERLGFTREGILRERWVVAGETSDSWLMGLLRKEWRPPDPESADCPTRKG